ncbi:hypothetical protein niasHT_007624 [Heterodera trifolii]|uniref:Uncharacterized protein n=1 Tax=Heterodera trifolii TaxID=157864 RepID=A0ABD2I3J3_9BILA
MSDSVFNSRKRSRIDAGHPSSPQKIVDSNLINTVSDNVQNVLKQLDSLSAISTIDNDALNVLLSAVKAQLLVCSTQLTQIRSMTNDVLTPHDLERQRSIVIGGVPESKETKPSARARGDNAMVEQVLDELGIQVSPVTVYRMGNSSKNPAPNGAAHRLLKVVLPARHFQRDVLSKWKKHGATLRRTLANQGLDRMNVRPSLSPEELVARRALHEECQTKRNETGNDWIVYAQKVILRSDVNSTRNNRSFFPTTPSLLSKNA